MRNLKTTRMELLRLKRQFKTAQRGYSLLEEKRKGLMRKFMELIKELKEKRQKLDFEINQFYKDFYLTNFHLFEKEILDLLSPPILKLEVEAKKINVMGTSLPVFEMKIQKNERDFSGFLPPLGFEKCLEKLISLFHLMVKVTTLEHAARILAFEIEKTRRRINALEYVIIPRIKKGVKFIFFKLDERERGEKILKIKMKK